FGQLDAARFQKIAHTVVSWLSIYMKFVFDGYVKRPEWRRVTRRPSLQEFIKHRFPGGRVKICGVRHYTVHVKQSRVITVACNETRLMHLFFESEYFLQPPRMALLTRKPGSRIGCPDHDLHRSPLHAAK